MKPIRLTEAEKTLLRAADYIEERGWCQHTCISPDGSVCALYAISKASETLFSGVRTDALEEFERRINAPTVCWNDQPGRTKEEVIAALRLYEGS